MISIIVSTYQPNYFSKLEKNIAQTCGVPYEIIKIENPGIMGICEAYNLGAQKSKYDYFLFLHEDVEFVTQNWGLKLYDHLKDESIGVIGIAGTNYVPYVPFAWWKKKENAFANLIQCYKNSEKNERLYCRKKTSVLALDGVFLACRRNVFEQFKFSENLRLYHGYDLSFTINVSSKYTNLVINDILLKHSSGGNPDENWFNEILKTRQLYKIPKKMRVDREVEYFHFLVFSEYLRKYKFLKMQKLYLLWKYSSLKRLGLNYYFKTLKKIYNFARN